MGTMEGAISVSGLPPHLGLMLHLCFYKVSGFEAPPPYGGDPPASAAIDVHQVSKDVHPEKESHQAEIVEPFRLTREPGYYYVQVRAVLFRDRNGSLFAQAEQFFFGRRPVHITDTLQAPMTFPVAWPEIPIAQLQHYGTFKPRGKGCLSLGLVMVLLGLLWGLGASKILVQAALPILEEFRVLVAQAGWAGERS